MYKHDTCIINIIKIILQSLYILNGYSSNHLVKMVQNGIYELRHVRHAPEERTMWSFTTYNGSYLESLLWQFTGCIKDCTWTSVDGLFTGIVCFYKGKTRDEVASLFIHDADYKAIVQQCLKRKIVTIYNNTITEEQ